MIESVIYLRWIEVVHAKLVRTTQVPHFDIHKPAASQLSNMHRVCSSIVSSKISRIPIGVFMHKRLVVGERYCGVKLIGYD
jgi:hypothetical protein